MSAVTLDEKGRVLLNKKVREVSGIRKSDKLAVIPFKGGAILVALRGKSFNESLKDFDYKEDEHEASKYLFRRKT